MLALETGWTPADLAELPAGFRAGCHWALYARVIAGPEGFPDTSIPTHASPDVKSAVARQAVEIAKQRDVLYPEDDG